MEPAGKGTQSEAPKTGTTAAAGSPAKAENAGLKFVIDMLPLVAFFGAYKFFGLKPATAVLMGVTLTALIAERVLLGKISPMLTVTAALVTVFGGLTLAFDDPRFLKMKPTAINLLLAGALGYGLATGRPLLKSLLGEAMHLTEQGWRVLTMRWIGLFLGLAVLNEIIWRKFNTPETEYIWVDFKVFGILTLTMIFAALQVPLLRRHAAEPDD